MKKPWWKVLWLLFVPLLMIFLSGCIDMELDITINSNSSGKAIINIAATDPFYNGFVDELIEDIRHKDPQAKVKESYSGLNKVAEITLSFQEVSELSEQGFYIYHNHYEDKHYVEIGEIDGVPVKITLNMPGRIISSNGNSFGSRVTWEQAYMSEPYWAESEENGAGSITIILMAFFAILTISTIWYFRSRKGEAVLLNADKDKPGGNCSNCGSEIHDDEHYCANCGTPRVKVQSPLQEQKTRVSSWKPAIPLLFLVIIILVLIMGVGAYTIFKSSDNQLNSILKKLPGNYLPIGGDASQETGATENERNVRGNSIGNLMNGGIVAKQGDWIYFLFDDDQLYKIRTDGTATSLITSDSAFHINVVGDWIYYNNSDEKVNDKIYKIRTDGTERTLVTSDSAFHINVVDDWIYYIIYDEKGDDKIYKVRTDGTERTLVSTDRSWAINVVDDWIYYSNSDDANKIYKIRTDGTERTLVSTDRSWAINVVDDWIYYIIYDEKFDDKIYKVRTDGTERTLVSTDRSNAINVVDDWIYYSNSDDANKIYKIRTDGTGRAQLNNDENSLSINVIDGWLYYNLYLEDIWQLYKIDLATGERQKVYVDSTTQFQPGAQSPNLVGLSNSDPDFEDVENTDDFAALEESLPWNGGIYIGPLKNGMPHGYGEWSNSDGKTYFGDFIEGKMTGQGIMVFPGGEKYVGDFLNGKGHGQGTMTHSDGRRVSGTWNNGDYIGN